MSGKIRAAVLHGVDDMRMEEIDRPSPKPNEALVKMKSVGVCGSDVHFLRHGRIGSYVVEQPLILGHECSGEVVETGSEVTNVKAGDPVVFEPEIACHNCWYCKDGIYNLCRDVSFMGTTPFNGAFVEYVAWPSNYLFKMVEPMTFQEGALVEPFAVGLYAAREAGFYPSASSVIYGAGPIGLVTLEAVKALGGGRTIVIDLMPNRLEMAQKMGATHVIDLSRENVVERVHDLTNGEGANFVFETAGSAKAFHQTVEVARVGGHVAFVGIPQEVDIPMLMLDSIIKELSFSTVFRYRNIFEEAIALIAHKRVDVTPVMTHQFSFDQTLEAFDVAEKQKDKAIKVMVNFD